MCEDIHNLDDSLDAICEEDEGSSDNFTKIQKVRRNSAFTTIKVYAITACR